MFTMATREQQDDRNYELIRTDTGTPIKAWVKGVQLEDAARKQLINAAQSTVHSQVDCGHARCALRYWRHGGQRDSHQGRRSSRLLSASTSGAE